VKDSHLPCLSPPQPAALHSSKGSEDVPAAPHLLLSQVYGGVLFTVAGSVNMSFAHCAITANYDGYVLVSG